jgi:hypothetical protein
MNAMKDFPDLLESLFVMEYGKTPEEAARLVKKHTRIVTNAIMGGLSFTSVRAAAMAIEMAEAEEKSK